MTRESKKKWVLPKKVNADQKLAEELRFSPIIAGLLKARGYKSKKEIETFLNPSLEQIPDPKLLANAEKAADQIIEAVKAKHKIVIHGDFDADGICATALLWEFLYKELPKHLDVDPDCVPYIPDRVDEGYGLSKSSIDGMIALGAELVITVDCGVRDKVLIKQYKQEYKKEGLDFIITDHHQPPEGLLDDLSYTVVHQMYSGKEFPYLEICGTAIAWLLIQVIREKAGIKVDDKVRLKGMELVALSTVTDMMPLTGINRVFVSTGLKRFNKGVRLGLDVLAKYAKINNQELDAYHLGFVIGPRINAAGRIGSPIEALKLLISTDDKNSDARASTLNNLNFKRQKMTDEIINVAKSQVEMSPDNLLHFIIGENWSEGIIGLVAGKIQEEYGKPTIVVTINGEEARGSARSLSPLNITSTLDQFADRLIKYGGHAKAAGFTIASENLEQFKKDLVSHVNSTYKKDDFIQELEIDLLVDANEMELGFLNELDRLRPYGYGNRTPVLMIEKAVVLETHPMGSDRSHLALTLKGSDIGSIKAVMFSCNEDIEKIKVDDVIDLAGSLNINEWNGNRSVQFQVSEWRRSVL